MMSRETLKAFIENELWDEDLDFSNPIQRNQSQRIALKVTID